MWTGWHVKSNIEVGSRGKGQQRKKVQKRVPYIWYGTPQHTNKSIESLELNQQYSEPKVEQKVHQQMRIQLQMVKFVDVLNEFWFSLISIL